MRRLLLALLLLSGVLLGACSSKTTVTTASPSASSTPAAEPKTAGQLKYFSLIHFTSFSDGDFGSFWDDFDTASKAVVSRAEYIRRLESCMRNDPNKNAPFNVVKVAENKDGTWSVTMRYVKYDITFPARYEANHWRFILSADARKAMRMPVSQYLATQCHH
jgi:hypothetical protein